MANPRGILPDLTAMQDAFVLAMVETGDKIESAKRAGYVNPETQGRQLAAHPAVMMAVRYETQRKMQGLVPSALSVLEKLMLDDDTPKGVKLQAAMTVLDRSGYAALKREIEPDQVSLADLNQLSIGQLERLVADMEKQRADQAKLVEPLPASNGASDLGLPSDSSHSEPLFLLPDDQPIDPLG